MTKVKRTKLAKVLVFFGIVLILGLIFFFFGDGSSKAAQLNSPSIIWAGDFPLAQGGWIANTEIGLRSDGVVVWRDKKK